MKKLHLAWTTGCAMVIGAICATAPSVERVTAQSSPVLFPPSFSPTPSFTSTSTIIATPTPTYQPSSTEQPTAPPSPQPPFVFPPSLCDRLTGTICNNIPQAPTYIGTFDQKPTEAVCAYAGTCPPIPPVTLAFAQQQLQQAEAATESNTALIYYTVYEDRIEILIIPSSGKEIRKVVTDFGKAKNSKNKSFGKEAIDSTVLDFLSAVRDPSSQDYLIPAQTLYDVLIRPIEADITSTGAETLTFVMDGSLRSLPIAALHDGQKFLAQKYATATVPSLGLVNLKVPDRRRNSILAMGLTKEMQGFTAIPNVGVEVGTITSQILGGTPFVNEDFTIDNLTKLQEQNNYGIVHLATHAQFLSNTADGAFIQFWNERLSLDRLREIKIGKEPIEMLTLSACQTAIGQNLGLSGIALIYRAKSVLASLWKVDDAGTTPLMLDFYHNYPTAKSKALALQKAQVDLIEGRVRIENQEVVGIANLRPVALAQVDGDIDLRHPYFWSSFVLVGNWL